MTSPADVRAAISYAHGRYDKQILALADRLNREGVDCELDLYDEAPPQGWPQWMLDTLATRVVIAVCTAEYTDRIAGRPLVGVGRGVAWEGRILKGRVYEGQGRNEGVVPVVLSTADVSQIPDFLKDVTHYDLSQPDGYELLYRRLTRQPRYVKPSLGAVRELPSQSAPASAQSAGEPQRDRMLVLLDIAGVGTIGVPAVDITRDATLKVVLAPEGTEDAGHLAALRTLGSKPIGVAYRLTATRARVKSVREVLRDGAERIELELLEEELRSGLGTDMSYNNISADELAMMRARRILLDEKLPENPKGTIDMNGTMLDLFVSGRGGIGDALAVKASPFPALAAQGVADRDQFLAFARLLAVLMLRLSGVVERILRLDLRFISEDALAVHFSGVRAKVYSNVEPSRIEVTGTCELHA